MAKRKAIAPPNITPDMESLPTYCKGCENLGFMDLMSANCTSSLYVLHPSWEKAKALVYDAIKYERCANVNVTYAVYLQAFSEDPKMMELLGDRVSDFNAIEIEKGQIKGVFGVEEKVMGKGYSKSVAGTFGNLFKV